LTSKGQVTIPKAMRDAIGLREGSVVAFHQDGDRIVITRSPNDDFRNSALVRRLRGSGRRVSMSGDELIALMRGEDA
jgi:AbrB family looped-hinge helix DNA binding protein